MSLEEIESRLGSLIQADTITQLKSAVWKERLEGLHLYLNDWRELFLLHYLFKSAVCMDLFPIQFMKVAISYFSLVQFACASSAPDDVWPPYFMHNIAPMHFLFLQHLTIRRENISLSNSLLLLSRYLHVHCSLHFSLHAHCMKILFCLAVWFLIWK